MKKTNILLLIISIISLFVLCSCKGDEGIPREFRVRFNTKLEGVKIKAVTIKEGFRITGTEIDLNKIEEHCSTKAIFRGWYSDEALTKLWDVDNYRVFEDITLYAKWSFPELKPTEIEVTDDPFSNSICWIQDGITTSTDISVKLLKATVTEATSIDPNDPTSQTLIRYEEVTYPEGDGEIVDGSFNVDGFNVKYTFSEKISGGVYQALIITNNGEDEQKSIQRGLRFKGCGSTDDPYLIYTEQDLEYLTTHSYDKDTYSRLMSDVTLRSIYNDKKGSIYDGIFDGNGYTVTLKNNSGVFFELGEHAEVSNLYVSGAISGSDPSIGVIANYNNGYIHNCKSISVSVVSDGGSVNVYDTFLKGGAGGIVGTNKEKGRISECAITSGQANIIKGRIGIGGIAGVNYGEISRFNGLTACSAIVGAYNGKELSNTISNSFSGVAVGINFGVIKQVNCDGKINTRRNDNEIGESGAINVGGVCGYNAKGGLITECLFQGMRCVGDTNVGGIAGFNDGTIESCFTGRRVRKPSGTEVAERQFISPVIGSKNVGGIAGKCGPNSVITNCFSTANVFSYLNQAYTIAEKCTNCIGVVTNQNPRLSSNYTGRQYGVPFSNDLLAPIEGNNIILDNHDRIGSVEHNLLGCDYINGLNVQNTTKIIEYLTFLGDKFGYNKTYGISLCWQSGNTNPLSYYKQGA